jgi:hypothetical protein
MASPSAAFYLSLEQLPVGAAPTWSRERALEVLPKLACAFPSFCK